MNLFQMQERVRVAVSDNGLVDSLSLDLFNQGLREVAEQVNLPALDTWATVTVPAATSSVSLPAGFMRELHTVRDQARPDVAIAIVSSVKALVDQFGVLGDKKGPIEACCEEDGALSVAPQPTEETVLTVGYYREPTALADSLDVPDCIPSAFHASVLVNYVAWKLYELIEDGMSGERVMSDRYGGDYLQGVALLADRYRDTSRKHARRVSRARFF